MRKVLVVAADHLPKVIARRFTSSSWATRAVRPLVNALLPERPTSVTVVSGNGHGLRLEILPRSEKYYWLGTYEPAVVSAICGVLRPGSVFWDVGAHIGYLTAIAARIVGPTGEVVAFEPNPDNLVRLRSTIELNGFRNVSVRPVALSDGPSELTFHLHASSSMGYISASSADDETLTVQASTLDREGRAHRAPDVIKIDVEGHEREVICGGEVTLGQGIPTLVIEVLSETRRREVAGLLRGYELGMLDKTNMLGTPIVQTGAVKTFPPERYDGS